MTPDIKKKIDPLKKESYMINSFTMEEKKEIISVLKFTPLSGETLYREVTFVEKITSSGTRQIVDIRAVSRSESGQLIEDEDAQIVAREYLRNYVPDWSLEVIGYPCRVVVGQNFLEWPKCEKTLAQPISRDILTT